MNQILIIIALLLVTLFLLNKNDVENKLEHFDPNTIPDEDYIKLSQFIEDAIDERIGFIDFLKQSGWKSFDAVLFNSLINKRREIGIKLSPEEIKKTINQELKKGNIQRKEKDFSKSFSYDLIEGVEGDVRIGESGECETAALALKKFIKDINADYKIEHDIYLANVKALEVEFRAGKDSQITWQGMVHNPVFSTLNCSGSGNYVDYFRTSYGAWLDGYEMKCKNGSGKLAWGNMGNGAWQKPDCSGGFTKVSSVLHKPWQRPYNQIYSTSAYCPTSDHWTGGVGSDAGNLGIYPCADGTVIKEIQTRHGNTLDAVGVRCAPIEYDAGFQNLKDYAAGKLILEPQKDVINISQFNIQCQKCTQEFNRVAVDGSLNTDFDIALQCAQNVDNENNTPTPSTPTPSTPTPSTPTPSTPTPSTPPPSTPTPDEKDNSLYYILGGGGGLILSVISVIIIIVLILVLM
jgi:hypothetical protein